MRGWSPAARASPIGSNKVWPLLDVGSRPRIAIWTYKGLNIIQFSVTWYCMQYDYEQSKKTWMLNCQDIPIPDRSNLTTLKQYRVICMIIKKALQGKIRTIIGFLVDITEMGSCLESVFDIAYNIYDLLFGGRRRCQCAVVSGLSCVSISSAMFHNLCIYQIYEINMIKQHINCRPVHRNIFLWREILVLLTTKWIVLVLKHVIPISGSSLNGFR